MTLLERIAYEAKSPLVKPVLVYSVEFGEFGPKSNFGKVFTSVAQSFGVTLNNFYESSLIIPEIKNKALDYAGILFTSIRSEGFDDVFKASCENKLSVTVITGAPRCFIPQYIIDNSKLVLDKPFKLQDLFPVMKKAFSS